MSDELLTGEKRRYSVRSPGRGGARPNSGGARSGAGRKPGGSNALPLGTIAAIRAANLRVPKEAPPPVAELANWSLERIVDVVAGRVHSSQANAVLVGARALREEACGPIPKRTELSGPGGKPFRVRVDLSAADE